MGGSKSEVVDRKRISNSLDGHLDRSSPSTSRPFNGKDFSSADLQQQHHGSDAMREAAKESITERLSSMDDLYFPRASLSSAATPPQRKSLLLDLLFRDVAVFLGKEHFFPSIKTLESIFLITVFSSN
ncbi:hypothetical protein Tsubulata_040927 [Turnera subulata]|uniref:Uncharacterized protein n=1 Tax=Turnera subulata TaxID=218843 RepID=A0A9Q0FF53_9ROSI|nr:hypothetical protein Tsubulata_040927 [Turnera subulata]